MPTEQRTLEIVARARDLASRVFSALGRNFARVVRFSFLAPLRILQTVLRTLRSLLLSFGAAALAAFAFFRGGQSVLGVVETADAMSKLARSTGSTTEQITALRVAMQFSGIEGERFRSIMTGLGRGVSQALRTLRGPQFEAFSRLGIDIETLRRGDFEELFRRIAQGLRQFNTEAEKAAILQGIFPDNFQRLLPLLGDGEKAFLANVKAARAFGAELSGPLGQAAEQFNNELLKLKTAASSAAREGILGLVQEVLPMVRGFAVFVQQNRDAIIPTIQALVRVLFTLIVVIAKLLVEIVSLLQQGLGPLLDKLREAGFIGSALADVLGALGESVGLKALTGDARAAQRELEEAAQEVATLEAELTRLQGLGMPQELGPGIARLTAQLDKARARLTEAGDRAAPGTVRDDTARGALDIARLREFLDRISSGSFQDDLKLLGEQSLDIFRTTAEEVDEAFEENTQHAMGFFESFTLGVSQASERWRDFAQTAADAGRSLIDRGFNAISDGLSAMILGTKSAKEAFKDMAKAILEEIARIIPRLLLVRLLGGIFGSPTLPSGVGLAEGGVTKSVRRTIPMRRFAQGGVATSPTFALFGEAGAEAFVPLRSGRIPVRIEGPTGGNFVFAPSISAMDGRSVKRLLIEERQTLVSIWQHELQRTTSMKRGLREQVR